MNPTLRVGLPINRRSRGILGRPLVRQPRVARRPRVWRSALASALIAASIATAVTRWRSSDAAELAAITASMAERASLFADVLKINPGVALEACATDSECEAAEYWTRFDSRD